MSHDATLRGGVARAPAVVGAGVTAAVAIVLLGAGFARPSGSAATKDSPV
jgi:hypothetical protein